jgi:hypothetical protein
VSERCPETKPIEQSWAYTCELEAGHEGEHGFMDAFTGWVSWAKLPTLTPTEKLGETLADVLTSQFGESAVRRAAAGLPKLPGEGGEPGDLE